MKTNLNIIAAAALVAIASIAGAQTVAGTGAFAQSGIAIGNNAMSGNVAAGTLSPTQPAYTGAVAIGNGANASGRNIAIGDGISAPQDGIEGMYTFAIGGLNVNTGTFDLRRIVGVAKARFRTDGASYGDVLDERDLAISQANQYTDNALAPVNFTLGQQGIRLGSVESSTAANSARLDQHDVTLASHDQRITAAQDTADTALTVATGADSKATVALDRSGRALNIATQAQRDVAQLSGRMTAVEARMNGIEADTKRALHGVAIVSAMAAANPVIEAGKDNAMSVAAGTYGKYGAMAMAYSRRTSYGAVTARVGYTTTQLAASVATGWSW